MIDAVEVPESVSALAPFVEAGVFGASEVRLAETVVRLHRRAVEADPDEDGVPALTDEEVLALAVAARGPRLGHVCVELADVAARVLEREAVDLELPWPDPASWAEVLEGSELVQGAGTETAQPLRPLVWDGSRLYLHRFHAYEEAVAADLARRADAVAAEPTASLAALDRLFPAPPDGSVDRQRQAAEVALTRSVSVIAGGPGTGKTRTIARLLAAALEPGGPARDVALAAPTGKAAARMTDAVQAAVGECEASGVIDATVADRLRGTEASTIHRLLGARPGGRFGHDRGRPLPHDLVIVDETSMVALPLMARLLDAVRPGARVVLVGDPDQLASVEAGTVLADLVGPARHGDTGATGPLAGRVTVLDRVHRFGAASGIADLAGAVRSGDVEGVLELLGSRDDLSLVAPDGPDAAGVLAEVVETGVGVVDAARAGDDRAAVAGAGAVKVLAAQHRGANGRLDWGIRVERAVLDRVGDVDRRGRWYVGRPVLVTSNDPLNRVHNGDTGVVVDHGSGQVVALPDPRAVDGFRKVLPSRLHDVETWWSMTIHKSQGSEFPHVVVALPNRSDAPVLTRELLYTAITRARERVTVVATEDALRAAVGQPVARASGLADRLWH